MKIYFIILIFLIVTAEFGSGNYDCPVKRCSKHGPEIRFPFRLKGQHSEHCGYPGFDLYCSPSKKTVLEHKFPVKSSTSWTMLPDSEQFIVEKINYQSQSISVTKMDDSCFLKLFPQLNLSASPFSLSDQYNDYANYTIFNCSSSSRAGNGLAIPISCLSRSSYNVYAAPTNLSLYQMLSCTKISNVSSVSYSLFDRQDGTILLRWSKPTCKHCESQGRYCRLKNNSSIHDTECFLKDPVPGKSKKKPIKGIGLGVLTIGILIFLFERIYSFKKKKGDEKRIEQFLEDYRAIRPTRYTYADLKKITDHFKEKLGQGGYGTVYKGKLSNDILVAVKILNHFKGDGEDFINEVGTIGRIHHVNVVRLVGYCADGCRRGLVYEFLPNDSLKKYISSGNQSRSIGWEKLQQIAIGIAKGLDYLHQGCNERILHFDIKPHNILLDQNFNPKVADFGLAKLFSKEKSIVSMSAARGTIGYIAPEVFSRNYGSVSYKADIYSFGMLLLDMVGGRKKFNAVANDNSEVYYPEWMYNQLEKGEEIGVKIDIEEDNVIFKKLTIVGLWCIQWHPAGRPSLKVVIQMIGGDEIPIIPPNPFASTRSSPMNTSAARGKFYNALEIISEQN